MKNSKKLSGMSLLQKVGLWFLPGGLLRFLLAFLLFLYGGSYLQADPARWIIKDKDTTLILFGTLHILAPETRWLSPLMKEDLRQIDRLYLEVSPQSKTADKMSLLIREKGFYPGPPGLLDRMDGPERERLEKAASNFGLQQINAMRPWFAATTLAAIAFKRAGYDPDAGVEAVLIREVTKSGKAEIRGLETAREQIDIFASQDEKIQQLLLKQTLSRLDQADDFMQALTRAWRAGDLDTVADILDQDFAAIPAFRQAVLVSRTRKWAQVIPRLLEEPGAFVVAVGIAHLVAEDNLIDTMAAQGIEVSRLEK